MVAWVGLSATGFMLSGPLPGRALVFWREFERSGQGEVKVSLQERVVYSLLEATEQTGDHPQTHQKCM